MVQTRFDKETLILLGQASHSLVQPCAALLGALLVVPFTHSNLWMKRSGRIRIITAFVLNITHLEENTPCDDCIITATCLFALASSSTSVGLCFAPEKCSQPDARCTIPVWGGGQRPYFRTWESAHVVPRERAVHVVPPQSTKVQEPHSTCRKSCTRLACEASGGISHEICREEW